jgi:hypothetical protein
MASGRTRQHWGIKRPPEAACEPLYFLCFVKWKLIYAHLLVTSWPSVCSILNILCSSANKTVVTITTQIMVFASLPANFLPLGQRMIGGCCIFVTTGRILVIWHNLQASASRGNSLSSVQIFDIGDEQCPFKIFPRKSMLYSHRFRPTRQFLGEAFHSFATVCFSAVMWNCTL